MTRQGGVTLKLSDIAAQLGGDELGDGQTEIRRVATLVSAGTGEIAFLSNRKYRPQLPMTRAAAVIVAPAFADDFAGPRIVTGDPYAYYARVASLLNPALARLNGVHPSAVSESPLPASVAVGPMASVLRRRVASGSKFRKSAGSPLATMSKLAPIRQSTAAPWTIP